MLVMENLSVNIILIIYTFWGETVGPKLFQTSLINFLYSTKLYIIQETTAHQKIERLP